MEKSFTDMVIARGWTQQQRDATSVTRDKVFEFQLNIGRIGIMKAICHKAAGMRWWPQETPVMANRSLAPCLCEDWRLCVAPVLLCWVKAAPGILWSIPPSTTSLNAFQMKAAVLLVQRVTTNRKESYDCWDLRGHASAPVFTLFVTVTKRTPLPSGSK